MSAGFLRLIRPSALFFALFALVFTAIQVSADTGDGPATATVRRLLASIGKLRTTTDREQRSKLIASINRSLAIEKLSEQALGAQWSKLDQKGRVQFVDLVQQALEKIAYPNAARFFSGFTVSFAGEELRGAQHVVRTTVKQAGGGAVSIDYVLEKSGGRWVIVDVILDRQSLAASLTSQIQATLKSSSYQDLVAQMQSRVKQADSVPK